MKYNSISEAEWEVMEVLWRQPDSSLSDVVEQLEHTKWSYSTIKTLLRRLVEKKFVEVDKSVPNSFRYRAAVEEQDCRAREAKNFLQRVFDGSVSMFVSTLAKTSELTKEEEEELMQIIKKMEEDG